MPLLIFVDMETESAFVKQLSSDLCNYLLGSWSERRWATEYPQLPPYHAWGRHVCCCSCTTDQQRLATRWQHNTALLNSVFLTSDMHSSSSYYNRVKAASLFLVIYLPVSGSDRSGFVYCGVVHNNWIDQNNWIKNKEWLQHCLENPPTYSSTFFKRARILNL